MIHPALLFSLGLIGMGGALCAQTAVVERGGHPTLSAALAALDRTDGIPDRIEVRAPRVREEHSLLLGAGEALGDPLVITGIPLEGELPCVIFADSIGPRAIDLRLASGARVSLSRLALIPEHRGKTERAFPHTALCIAAPAALADARLQLSQLWITSGRAGGCASAPGRATLPYEAHTRWSGAPAPSGAAALRIALEHPGSRGVRLDLDDVQVAHSGGTGIDLAPGAGVDLYLHGCSVRFAAGTGCHAHGADGGVWLEECTLSDNYFAGYHHWSGGGRLSLRHCRVDRNWGRERVSFAGLCLGGEPGASAPHTRILGGSFSGNGADEYGCGIHAWGQGGSLEIRGTPTDPVLFLENRGRGLRLENEELQLLALEHCVFAGHRREGLSLARFDLREVHRIARCAFLNNGGPVSAGAHIDIRALAREGARLQIEDCSFYNAKTRKTPHISVSDAATRGLALEIARCIFAGGPCENGRDERALRLNGADCRASLSECAFPAFGPHAIHAQPLEVAAGRGNSATIVRAIHADPEFHPASYFERAPARLGAGGELLRVGSRFYLAAQTPGRRDLGGFNAYPAERTGASERPLRVAIYSGEGANLYSVDNILQGLLDLELRHLDERAIQTGALAGIDAVIFPGGNGVAQSNALGATGRREVCAFVRRGGGFLGLCAGAYLASADLEFSLGLIDAGNVDIEHWTRGSGLVRLSLTAAGQRLLGDPREEVELLFGQGPLLCRAGVPELEDYTPLASFRSELHDRGAPEGVMIGTDAIVAGRYGEGRVLISSPHPESHYLSQPGMERYVVRALRWVGRRRDMDGVLGNER